MVLTWNRGKETANLLSDLHGQTFRDFEVVVVDNGSTDGIANCLERDFPWVRLIRSERNVGVAAGRNLGYRQARGDILVALDDDARLYDVDALGKVHRVFAERPDIGALVFKIMDVDAGRFLPLYWVEPGRSLGIHEQMYETTYLMGGAHALRSEWFRRVGGFPEEFFYEHEDLDLSFRLVNGGAGIFFFPEVVVHHLMSPIERPNWRKVYFGLRNRIWLCAKYLPLVPALLHVTAWTGFTLIRCLRTGLLRYFFRALRDGMAGLPAALRHRQPLCRKAVQKLQRLRGRLYY